MYICVCVSMVSDSHKCALMLRLREKKGGRAFCTLDFKRGNNNLGSPVLGKMLRVWYSESLE